MTPELADVIEEAYRVFARYTIGSALVVCNCRMCMSNEDERRLAETPLRLVGADLLAQYTNSAHDWDDGEVAREMRHFLPRYLELMALGDPPDNMGLDICLRRLWHAGWRQKWPADEVDVIERGFDALLRAGIDRIEVHEWPVGHRLSSAFRNLLTMIVTAGGDIERALAVWDRAADPNAVLQMAGLREWVQVETGRTYLQSAYLDTHPVAADTIGAFLVRPEVDQRLEAAFFELDDPVLQNIVSDAVWR